ncbi:hypothetical protein ABVK25_008729 [Lepraria finkii]|uniref:Uncharacterized protein n=1 Tax=Lepraria finkii TaxID=1340010 RepID=A0ABR4AZA2_9LECA
MHAHADSCGYTDYIDKYLIFPPRGPFPTPRNDSFECNVWGSVAAAALDINPCFNVYHILDTRRSQQQWLFPARGHRVFQPQRCASCHPYARWNNLGAMLCKPLRGLN